MLISGVGVAVLFGVGVLEVGVNLPSRPLQGVGPRTSPVAPIPRCRLDFRRDPSQIRARLEPLQSRWSQR